MNHGVKLSVWARQHGLTYKGAYRLFRAGQLPCRTTQLPTGTILCWSTEEKAPRAALYSRVSSHDQRQDLLRQKDRLRDFAASRGMEVGAEVSEIGSGLNGRRRGLIRILSDRTLTHVVVEHRDRLARFGVEYVEAALAASGRELIVMNETESSMDLVQDFADLATSMCARIYGTRSARSRARRAVEAATE
jgi:putative resolvase